MTIEPSILYKDASLLAVHKPSGMLVHRGWGRDDEVLADWVRPHVDSDKVHTIHRLDRATSGVVLFAQHAEAARQLADLFATRRIRKHYVALVRGIAPQMGYLDHPVPREPKGKERVEAQSSLRRIATNRDTEPRECSLVEVVPHTGRVHQIRRHLAHLNHPIFGDAHYGKGKLNRAFKEHYGLRGLALHALALCFEHPETRLPLRIVAPMAADLEEGLVRMGFDPRVWRDLEEGADEGRGDPPSWLEEAQKIVLT